MAIGPPTANERTRLSSVSSRSWSDWPTTTIWAPRPALASTRAVPSMPGTRRSTSDRSPLRARRSSAALSTLARTRPAAARTRPSAASTCAKPSSGSPAAPAAGEPAATTALPRTTSPAVTLSSRSLRSRS